MAVHAPSFLVFEKIKKIDNWKYWHPLFKDSLQYKTYTDENHYGIVNFQKNTKNYESGIIYISSIKNYKSIEYVVKLKDKGSSVGLFTLSEANDSICNINLKIEGSIVNNPLWRWLALTAKKNINKEIDIILNNLKESIENEWVNQFYMQEITLPERFTITQKDTASAQTVNKKMVQMFNRLSVWAKQKNIKKISSPFCIFHNYNDNYFSIEAGLNLPYNITTHYGNLITKKPAQKCVMVTYTGDYYKTNEIYEAMERYIAYKKYKSDGTVIEEYITNPEIVKDTAQWKMNIYFPIY